MKLYRSARILSWLLFALLLQANSLFLVAQSSPAISAVSPGSGVAGKAVTITGRNFGSSQGLSTVTLNGATMTVSAWSDGSIVVFVPAGATTGNVVVSVGGVNSNEVTFTIINPTSGFGRPITVSHTQVPNTDQLNFPALISGTYSFLATRANGGRVLNASGYDIIFTSDAAGQNLLNFEINNYNPTTGTAAFWVCIPSLSHAVDTTIYMWYGVAGISESQENKSAVWANNYVGVWHLGDGSTLSLADSTSNANNATNNGAVAAVGPIAGAMLTDGSTYATIGTPSSLSNIARGNATFSLWVNSASGAGGRLLGKDDGNGSRGWAVSLNGSHHADLVVVYSGSDFRLLSTGTTGDNVWSYVVVTLTGSPTGSSATIYINGVSSGTGSGGSGTTDDDSSQVAFLANATYGDSGSAPLVGSTAEFRISNIARSPDWIATEYNNQSAPATFYTVGQEQSSGGAPMPIILSVTPNPAPYQATISITGTGFGTSQGTGTITLNGSQLLPTSWGDDIITLTLPSNAAPGPIVVTSGGISGFPFSIIVAGPPTILSLAPVSGVAGKVIVITGSNFGTSQGSNSVTLNGSAMNVSTWSDNSIVAIVSTGATTGNVVVSVGGVSSNGVAFTVASLASGFYRSITISHTQVPNTDQVNFPVLVSGTYPFLATPANGGRVRNGNGYDILFTSDAAGQNPLSFEIDSYNPATGAAAFWVSIPLLSHTADTTVYMWYGIAGINDSQENKAAVWGANYAGVWHFPNGIALTANDSTANGNNGTPGTGVGAATGIIGGAASFNGASSAYISVPPSSSAWNFVGDVTVSGWVRTTSNGVGILQFQSNNPLVYLEVGPSTVGGNSNKAVAYFRTNSGGVLIANGNTIVNDNMWHYIEAVRSSGSFVNIYVDGSLDSTTPYSDSGEIDVSKGGVNIGGLGPTFDLIGNIDEVRVANTARSADWIATEYNNQSSPATFATAGQEQALSGAVPEIVSVTPTPVPYEGTITITGTGFGASQGSSVATLRGSPLSVTSWTDSSIVLTLPSNATSGPVVVTVGEISSLPFDVIVLGPPTISAVSPGSGVVGKAVTITGSGFGSSQGSSTVTLNGVSMTATAWSNSSIVVTVPASASTGNLVVSVRGIDSNGVVFTVANPSSGFYRPITISHAQVPNTDQVNFPVLVSGTYPFLASQSNGGRVLNANGYDIIFTSDAAGQNLLNFELENYGPTTGAAVYWVCIPLLSHTIDTTIYMWYGIPGISDSQANSSAVWGNKYAGVWHLPDGTIISANDSTVNTNNGTILGAEGTAGEIDGAASFNGTSNYIQLPQLNIGNTFSASAWFRTGGDGVIFGNANSTPAGSISTYNPILYVGSDSKLRGGIYNSSGAPVNMLSSSTTVNDGKWHLASYATDGTTQYLYLDGQLQASATAGSNSNLYYFIGTDWGNSWANTNDNWFYYYGFIDEVRLTKIALSSDWIATEYNNQSAPALFYGTGQEYSSSGALPTIQNVSPNPALSSQWVTVTGTGFGATQGALTLNGMTLLPTAWSDTSITFNLPGNALSGPLAVHVGSVSSSTVPFINAGASTAGGVVGTICPTLAQGEYVAWATPTQFSRIETQYGSVTGSLAGASMELTKTRPLANSWVGATWSNFQTPSIPANAVIKKIWAVEQWQLNGTGAATVNATLGNDPWGPGGIAGAFDSPGSWNVCSEMSSTVSVDSIQSSTLTAYLWGTMSLDNLHEDASVSHVGWAIYYTLPSAPSASIYLLNPYQLPGAGSGSLDTNSIISAVDSGAPLTAFGLVADGTSTAIAVYKTNVQQDVIFSVSGLPINGGFDAPAATVAIWDTSFLTKAPIKDTGALIVPASLLQSDGNGNYYAFALVQAPLGNSIDLITGTGIVEATQDVLSDGPRVTSFSLYPKPVILVHGLWGDANSLNSTWNYLNGKTYYPKDGNGKSWMLPQPACYSKVLPFDFLGSDTLQPPDSCPKTAKNMLDSVISKLYVDMNSNGVVGGRFDIVGHSMGGLVARFYSSLDPSQSAMPYRSYRNRNQGAFSTVVTLDTPEDGDDLASFLLKPDVAGATCKNGDATKCYAGLGNPLSDPSTAWTNACGTAPNTTLAECLNDLGNPLGPPGSGPGGIDISVCAVAKSSTIDCGAVASLKPDGPNMNPTALPNANIPNALWFAVGSDWKDDRSQTPSLLRQSLNMLLAGLSYNSTNATPTLSGILTDCHSTPGYIDNDVIVPTCSEFWDTNDSRYWNSKAYGAQTTEFADLAHSEVRFVWNLASYIPGYSNDAVTSSQPVNICVAGILLNLSIGTWCPNSSASSGQLLSSVQSNQASKDQRESNVVPHTIQETAEEQQRRLNLPYKLSPERLSVKAPEGTVQLGSPVEITLTSAQGELVNLTTVQLRLGEDVSEGGGPAKVVLDEGYSKTIAIIPAQLGPVDLSILAAYSDNAFAKQTVHLNVAPSSKGLKRFGVDGENVAMALVMEDKAENRQMSISPSVQYEGMQYPIHLKDCVQIKFSVEQSDDGDGPVASADKNCMVHALREGKAYLVGDFAGVKDRILVIVYSKEDAPPEFRRVIP